MQRLPEAEEGSSTAREDQLQPQRQKIDSCLFHLRVEIRSIQVNVIEFLAVHRGVHSVLW